MVRGQDESEEHFGRRQALVEYFRVTWNGVSVKMRECLYAVYKRCFPIQFGQDSAGLPWMTSPVMDEVNAFAGTQNLVDCSINWVGPTSAQPQPPLVSESTDVIRWWKNCPPHQFWRLRLIARAVLAVPGSAVACERIWSSAGRAFTKARGGLSSETGGNQVFLHEILKVQENIPFVAEHLHVAGLNKVRN